MFRVPTRSLLQSFWLALTVTAAVLIGITLWALDVPGAALWAIGGGAGLAAVGFARPELSKRPYESWKRVSRLGRRAARLWLTGVIFLVVTIVGWLGGRVAWKGPEPKRSGWIQKSKLPAGSYAGDSDIDQKNDAAAGWTRRYGEWAWRSGNAWAWSLIPLLALLKGVEGESAGSLGGNVYTLY